MRWQVGGIKNVGGCEDVEVCEWSVGDDVYCSDRSKHVEIILLQCIPYTEPTPTIPAICRYQTIKCTPEVDTTGFEYGDGFLLGIASLESSQLRWPHSMSFSNDTWMILV